MPGSMASRQTLASRSRQPRVIRRKISTWSLSSTACTTWATPPVRRHMSGNELEDNLNPVGRIYYAGSTMGCVPTSLSQEVGSALGAQAGEAKLREVIRAGGFRHIRRAAETPFNMILEARP